MKRAHLCVVFVVSALLAASGGSANADPVCDLATPLPVVGGLLSGGVQAGTLSLTPCPSATATTAQPIAGPGVSNGGVQQTTTLPAPSPQGVASPAARTPASPATRSVDKGASRGSRSPARTSTRTLTVMTEVFHLVSTPARALFTGFCTIALLIAMWMGVRVGRRKARTSADRVADAQLGAVMSVVPDAVVLTDAAAGVRAMNDAAADILGAREDDAAGTPLSRLLRGSSRAGISFESWMRGNAAHPAGTTGTLDNGLPVGLAGTPVKAGREIVGYVYLIRDLRKERALERMKEEFLSNVSHELRTPLASALGFARLLQRRQLSATQQGAFVGAIVEACERLDRVVDLLIDVAALEGGNVRTDVDRIDPAALVRETGDRWRERSTNHVISDRAEQGLPEMAASSSLLRNAIDELIDNAIKFSPDGGLVTISASSASGSRPMIALSVADQGIGIDGEKRETIFDDFKQVDGSATRRFGGLGIGLSFVRRVAEAHGGRVEIDSTPGVGSTFTLFIPVRAPRKDARPKSSKPKTRDRRAVRTLSLKSQTAG